MWFQVVHSLDLRLTENGKVQGGGEGDENESLLQRRPDVGHQNGSPGKGTPRDHPGET